jgi:hypothetical protein
MENMKFVDLSQDPPQEVKVLTLRECAYQVGRLVGVGEYQISRQFSTWIDSDVITTPAPDFTISEVDYWKPERLEEWKTLYESEIDKVEQRKSDALDRRTMSHNQLLDSLIEHAKDTVRRNSNAYSHNRGNSLRDGRHRTVELIGVKDFILGILSREAVPKDKLEEINTLISEAKAHVKMQ